MRYLTNTNRYSKREKFKKHYSQLTPLEYSSIEYSIKGMNFGMISMHFFENIFKRLKLKGVNERHLNDMLDDIRSNYTIIEVHNENDQNNVRVLVRGNKSFNGANLCLVFCLDSKNVVTGYINTKKDNHKRIDMSRYHNDKYNFVTELR